MLFSARPSGYTCAVNADELLDIEVERAAYWIRRAATERTLSLDQIAIFAGVSRSSVVQMGKGRNPTLRTLASVAAYLGCEVRDLLRPISSGTTPPTPHEG